MSKHVKYFRTYHLPWSESVADDDIVRTAPFTEGDEVVVTIKMDGENFTGYHTGDTHARSLNSGAHVSRDYVKAYWKAIAYNLPEGWRVCGENLYAKHSIHYDNLKSYLYVFSIWNDKNECLGWDETVEWAELIGIDLVEVIYRGPYNEAEIKKAFLPFKEEHEGYVVRSASGFKYEEAAQNIAKYVRKNHVQTSEHWMFQEVVPNKLA